MRIRLLSLGETVQAAAGAVAWANRPPFDPSRALEVLSKHAIVSMVILVGQLDAIAQASALTEDAWRRAHDGEASAQDAADASVELIRLLTAAGYLPLPDVPSAEEADLGQA